MGNYAPGVPKLHQSVDLFFPPFPTWHERNVTDASKKTQIHVERPLPLQLHLLRCCDTALGGGIKADSYHHIRYIVQAFGANVSNTSACLLALLSCSRGGELCVLPVAVMWIRDVQTMLANSLFTCQTHIHRHDLDSKHKCKRAHSLTHRHTTSY